MKNLKVLLISLFTLLSAKIVGGRASEKDKENFPQIDYAFTNWGDDVNWRSYEFKTKDNYILTMFRVMGDSEETASGEKGPLLLLHGWGRSSIGYFNRVDESRAALPVQLYKEGYDVWLANVRGTEYSRKHKYFDADKDPQYWNYDNSDIGEFDIYAMLKKITNVSTSCKKITLMGHSMGTL